MANAFQEAVYFYSPAPAGYQTQMKMVFARLGVRFHAITPAQTGETVGYLVGVDGFGPQPEGTEAPAVTDEVLILKNFTGRRIDAMLAALKKAGVPSIALKAVVTEHNLGWTFAALAEELRQEHEAFHKPQDGK